MNRSALDVANYYIENSDYTKTNLQIIKLTYIAHGHMLAMCDEPLIIDDVEAWKHGPVIPTIYHKFKQWQLSPIGKISYSPDPFVKKEKEVLDTVFAYYGRYCGYYLSQITHEDSYSPTPWKQCYVPGRNAIIPDEVTKAYYKILTEAQTNGH